MKICYIISTCDKYIETRVKYQMETMLKNVNKDDIYYLTSQPNISKRQFGWQSMDDPQNITWKYIHFIYNMNIIHYDWYIFIDDDTFVFQNRLEALLQNYNSNECYYIGKELDHIKQQFCLYMSGGAGYAISNKLYKLIDAYIKKIGINEAYYPLYNLKEQFCDDLCIGLWIEEIKKDNEITQINNNLFHIGLQNDDSELKTAITIHKVTTKEQYDFYYSITNTEIISEVNIINNDTVFALVTDLYYFYKAKRTIIDLRTKGNWNSEIVLVTIDFNLNQNFKDFYNIIEVKFPKIDKSNLIDKIGKNGFIDTTDNREIKKLNQWEKLHVFDDYFLKWSRVVFLDAGLRVLDDIKYLLELNYKDKLLAPKDGKLYDDQAFNCQISYDKPELIDSLKNEFSDNILQSNYMLNCIWIYDTNILKICNKKQLIEAMDKYTFCKTNEMGIMNILFHFKYKLWEQLPIKATNGKILFDWCELNNSNTNWRDYCYIKYPVTISFDDC
jgi:hypothetical protein